MVLTSNRTREVHDALKRRCLYHWIDYPTAQQGVRDRARPACPTRRRGSRARSSASSIACATADLTKVPGVAETLDWAAALLSLGAAELSPDVVDETLGVVLKYEEDIRQVRGATASTSPRGSRAAPRRPAPSSRARHRTAATRTADPRRRTGEAVDGRRLLAEAVGFGRALRAAGLGIDMAASIDFARALTLVDIGNKGIVRDAGAALFVRRRDDREVYDRVFNQFWRRRGRKLPRPRLEGLTPDAERDEEGEPGASDEAGEGREASMSELATMGVQVATDAERRGRDRGRDDLARRLFGRGDPASPRLRPDDLGRAARRRAVRGPAAAAARAPPDPAVRAPPPRPARRPARDVPPEPGHGRADRMGLAPADPRAAPAGRAVRHLGLDGAPLAAAAPLRAGARPDQRGADRVVRVRDAAHAGHPDHEGPRS